MSSFAGPPKLSNFGKNRQGVNPFLEKSYPCRCLCFGFLQITRKTDLRRINRHLSHIFRTDGRTFIEFLFYFCFSGFKR